LDGRKHFTTSVGESPFYLAIFKPIERATGNEQQIVAGGHALLLVTERLAKAAFGAGALDGIADGGAGSDHADAGGSDFFFGRRDDGRGAGFGGRINGDPGRAWCRGRGGLTGIPKHKGAAIVAAPVGADMLEIQLAPQMLLGAKTHVRREDSSGAKRPRA
jgi:hypothetical protein